MVAARHPALRQGIAVALALAILVAPGRGRAQEAGESTVIYAPAMLPGYVGDLETRPDAPRYDIDLALDVTPAEAIITGAQTVHYTNRSAETLDQIVFRLYPNLKSYGGEMAVSRVAVDGQAVAPGLDETRTVLSVPLRQPLAPGARVVVEMDFQIAVVAGRTRLYAQFSYLGGVLALPNAYPMLSVYEPGRGWWRVVDHPQGDVVHSETAFFHVRVTAPDDLILAASGSEVDLVDNGDGTLTHHYVAPLMRDFAVFASESYVTLSGEQDGVAITLYFDPDRPHAQAAARAGLAMTQDAVRIFNASFGGYPFAELDVVQTPTGAGGIEYPGVFVVTDSIWNPDEEFFEFVIAHEAAHQWWYSLVGNDQALNPWMDEALAQYSAAVYIRDREGEAAYQAALESFRAQYTRYVGANEDNVIGEPVTAYPANAYFFLVYQKGPLFFAALDEAFGYDAVNRMLRDYFAAHRYGIAEPNDMLTGFEAALGQDLDDLFEAWVGPFAVG
jgi:aminopeptidase N